VSEENVKFATDAYADPRGLSAMRERIAPDAVFDFSDLYPDAPLLRGVEAVREFRKSAPWEELEFEADEVLDVGDDRVLVLVRTHAKGKSSGVAVEQEVAHVLTIRDGCLVHFKVYPDREQALSAVGLADRKS
jgi:ketosteroid isomerase-like protein